MVSFKDKINNINDQCTPGGRVVDFKTKLPPAPPGITPPPEEKQGIPAGIAPELEDKLDTIIELLSRYKGGKFSSKVLKTKAATPLEIPFDNTQPSPDPSIIGFYDDLDIHNSKTPPANAQVLWVICDGPVDSNDPFIYIRSSPDRKSFSQEVPVRLGEKWGFEDVYDLRIRSALQGTQYRVTEYDNQLTYVSVVVNTPLNIAANRPSFTDINVPVNLAESILPSITIPDGFAIAIRSSVDNPFGSKIFTSSIVGGTAVSSSRNTLLPGDVKEYFISNANVIRVAGDRDGLTLDISVEQ